MLEARLLGQFHISLEGKPVDIPSRVDQSLLAYLILNAGTAYRREHLAGLFWPDSQETSAKSYLRHALWRLRKSFNETCPSSPDYLQANKITLAFNPDYPCWVDTALLAGETGPDLEDLLAATHVYTGELLPGFYDEWVVLERERLRAIFDHKMQRLLDQLQAARRWQDLIRQAERWISLGNSPEPAYRALIRAHAELGNVSNALVAYNRCVNALELGLGVNLSVETVVLVERVRSGLPLDTAASGKAIRGYQLLEPIGKGGYGIVYRARQPSVDRDVAIKVIQTRFSNRPDFIRRFQAEAQLIARLEHPNIVALYDFWREPDGAFLVMRWMRGGNLRSLLKKGRVDLERAAGWIDQLASGLAAAHERGIVHGDLKPENLLFDRDGNIYLSDFGIARQIEGGETVTAADYTLSPRYSSPEHLLDEPLTPQSDLYCLGVLLYEMLAGEPPFKEKFSGTSERLLPPLSSLRQDLPPLLDEYLQRATNWDPAGRFPDAASMDFALFALRDVAAGWAPFRAPESERREVGNPYKGLHAFEEADAADFFGRGDFVELLLDELSEMGEDDNASQEALGLGRFLAVVGPSGSGKSSVVKAGLLPALRQGRLAGSEKWFITEMTPGDHPLEELEAALLRVAVNPPASLLEQLRQDERGILRAVKRVLPGDPQVDLLLVIDQFEELFALVDDPDLRQYFLNSLLTAVAARDSRLRLVLTLRADFYDRPLMYPGFAELVRQHTQVVLPLSADELAEAIRDPADRVGVSFEEGLISTIVAEVNTQPGALPLMQYALTELFERRQDGRLTQATYQEMGGVPGALSRRADELYEHLSPTGQEIARQLFLRLVTLGEEAGADTLLVPDTRRRVLRSELEAIVTGKLGLEGDELEQGVFAQILETFGRHHLLSFDRDPLTRTPTVEIAHEALLREWTRLRGWIQESRGDIRMQRLLAAAVQDWLLAGKDLSYLLHGTRLELFYQWSGETGLALTAGEANFLRASRAEHERQEAEEAARRAREQTQVRISISRELAATAISNLGTDPELSILLALQALDTHRTQQAEDALHRALQSSRVLFSLVGHKGPVDGIDFSPDGSRLVTTGEDALKIWSAASGKLLCTIPYPDYLIGVNNNGPAVFDSSGSHVAVLTASQELPQDNEIITFRSWDIDKGDPYSTCTLPIHMGMWDYLAFSPDWRLLVHGKQDGSADLWDLHTVKRLLCLTGFEDQVIGAFFSPSGDHLAAVSPSGQVVVWDVPASLAAGEAKPLVSFRTQSLESLFPVAFKPDGTQLVLGFSWGAIEVWDLGKPPELIVSISAGIPVVLWLCISPDGSLLASATFDGKATVYDLTRLEPVFSLVGHQALVGYVAFSPDGKQLATSSGDGTARVWNAQRLGGGELFAFPSPRLIFDLELSPSEQLVAIGHTIGPAQVLDLQSGAYLLTLEGKPGTAVYRVSFSPDGRHLATCGVDNINRIWDVQTGKLIRSFSGHGEGQTGFLHTGTIDIAYSPDGKRLATAGTDGVAKVWDVETGDLLLIFDEHIGGLCSLAFSPDGRWIASASEGRLDNDVKVWDSWTGEVIYTMAGYIQRIWSLAFSLDSSLLAFGGENGVLEIWDLQTGERLHEFPSQVDVVWGLEFTSDSRQLFSGGNKLRVWDLETFQEVGTISDGAGFIALSRDGKCIYYARREGGVYGYLRNFEDVVALAKTRITRQLTQEERRQHLHEDTSPAAP